MNLNKQKPNLKENSKKSMRRYIGDRLDEIDKLAGEKLMTKQTTRGR